MKIDAMKVAAENGMLLTLLDNGVWKCEDGYRNFYSASSAENALITALNRHRGAVRFRGKSIEPRVLAALLVGPTEPAPTPVVTPDPETPPLGVSGDKPGEGDDPDPAPKMDEEAIND